MKYILDAVKDLTNNIKREIELSKEIKNLQDEIINDLTDMRIRLKISYREMEAKTGITFTTFSLFEKKKINYSIKIVNAYNKVFTKKNQYFNLGDTNETHKI